jgi:hypothetical protein
VVVEHRDILASEDNKRPRIKEKDLKNHISAGPEEEMSEEIKEKILDIRGVKVPGEEASDVVRRLIEEDNQVQRALDILTSWQILSNMTP